jgi:hypothetical protein
VHVPKSFIKERKVLDCGYNSVVETLSSMDEALDSILSSEKKKEENP